MIKVQIKKRSKNQLVITFKDNINIDVLTATAHYINTAVEQFVNSDTYIDIIDTLNCYEIPIIDTRLNISGTSVKID